MSKQVLFLILLNILCFETYAQKGLNNLSINGEATLPYFQNDQGMGFFLKGLYGIGRNGQLILSAGISRFNSNTSKETNITTRVIPFLLGYKRNFQKFFIESKIGIGELGGKISKAGDLQRPSIAAVFGGLAAGYTIKRFNFGINFLTAHGIENTSAGVWYNKNFHYTSVFVGYDLFAKSNH
ncbi:MAG: hypothetical protein ABIO04_12215 [Ferruginibacter sp.]